MNSIEWIFSGIGVVILAALFSPLRKYFLAWSDSVLRKLPFFEEKQIEYWVNNDSYKTNPSPMDIVENVRKLPPAQRENAERSYIGLKVAWSLKFNGFTLTNYGFLYPYIYCEVPIKDYPQLNIYHENRVIWLKGEIESVSGHTMNLGNCKLRLFD
jgi:hypothetical protein